MMIQEPVVWLDSHPSRWSSMSGSRGSGVAQAESCPAPGIWPPGSISCSDQPWARDSVL